MFGYFDDNVPMKRLSALLFLLACLANQTSVGQSIRAASDSAVKSPAKSTQTTPDRYTGRQILVGSGGGFTGFTTTYYLLENGKLFRRSSRDTTFTFLAQQTTARTKRLFNTLEGTCKIKKTRFDHPGNRYTFVRWRKGKQTYKVAWGIPGHTVPATYPKFVDSFMATIPASSKQK